MVIGKTSASRMPKYEEVRELKESEKEKLIRESYEMEFDSYSSLGVGRGFGPCLVGDISNCRCSKEELERQKALIELQRQKEKLEVERKQREEERTKFWEIERKKARMKAAWEEWETKNKQYFQEQAEKWPWERHENWRQGPSKPSSNLDDY